jgi:hypothetical protein
MDEAALAEVDHKPDASLELQRWYREGLRPRLTSALRRGIVGAGDVLALERDLRALIGYENDPESRRSAQSTSKSRRGRSRRAEP